MENYLMTIDTETANGLDDALVYDLGLAIHTESGEVVHTESLVISDIFTNDEIMASAYFAEKIPSYWNDIHAGIRKMVTFRTAEKIVKNLIKRYSVKTVVAHNAYFDYNALNTTLRYLTKSKKRFFLPWGVTIWDSLRMAKTTLAKDKNYTEWCIENNYLTEKYRKPKLTAEILYRYLTGNHAFMEEHTGLADVMIEKEITAYFLKRNHAGMKKCLFNPRKEEDYKTMLEWFSESLLCE
jgi:DNA polymerase III epsilon subunit-like protein